MCDNYNYNDISKQINDTEYLLRQLQKIDSKMMAGQFIPAWRAQRKLIAELEAKTLDLIDKNKQILTSSQTGSNLKENV